MNIDHVVLWVDDALRALDFYTRVVGLAPVRADAFVAGEAPFPSVRVGPGSILDLVPAAGAPLVQAYTGESTPSAAGRPLNHVCLALDPAEIDALEARLREAGVAIATRPEPSYGARGWTTRWFYFQDPDGNVLEARCYGE